eukprot:gene7151-21511_t
MFLTGLKRAASRAGVATVCTAAASTPLKMVVVLGSARKKRIGTKVAQTVVTTLEARGHEVTLLDPRETENGFFMQLMDKAYFHYKPSDGDHPPQELERTAAVVKEADAYVVVSPEYFGASAYKYKPSAMVSYSAGNWGGVRAAVGLRSFLGELGCIAVSASVPIPRAWKAFNDDGGLAAENQVKALDSMLDQLEWHATAMKNHRSDRGSDRT